MSQTTAAIREVIQRVYGDATQTALDEQCAREIVATLRRMGWASLDEVGRLIAAAGGEVTVTDDLMAAPSFTVTRQDDFASRGYRFRAEVSR